MKRRDQPVELIEPTPVYAFVGYSPGVLVPVNVEFLVNKYDY